MSASPIARQACSHAQSIPPKTVLVHDASQLPDVYSSTPGGTLYSTTPGGNYSNSFHTFFFLSKTHFFLVAFKKNVFDPN